MDVGFGHLVPFPLPLNLSLDPVTPSYYRCTAPFSVHTFVNRPLLLTVPILANSPFSTFVHSNTTWTWATAMTTVGVVRITRPETTLFETNGC